MVYQKDQKESNSVFSSFHLNCFYARQEKRRRGKIFSANLSYFISHFLVIRGIDKILIKMNFHAVYQLAPPMVCKSFMTKNRNSHLIDERTWSLHFSEYRAGFRVLHPTANSQLLAYIPHVFWKIDTWKYVQLIPIFWLRSSTRINGYCLFMLQHDVKISNDVICNNRIELKKKKIKCIDEVYSYISFLFIIARYAFYSVFLMRVLFSNFYI